MNGEPEVLFEVSGRAGLMTLNRPKAMNALTPGMIGQMHARLRDWAADDRIGHVVIRAAGERAFCAGGDIRNLYEWGRAGDPRAVNFYREEYRLDTLIKRYPKPYVALINGIVMGGGVGVSVHGTYRVGGDGLVFAMPETRIGLFPDVGGTYFLPRLPGELGTYLALTGERLGLADACWAGLVTHAVDAHRFAELVEILALAEDVGAALAAAAIEPPEPMIPKRMSAIDRCFSADRVEEVLERLDGERGEHAEWARETAESLRIKSPTSLKIALRQMRLGAQLDFEECMQVEFRIVSRIVKGHEFYEGVRAAIIDKDDQPRWNPATLTAVPDEEIDAYFAPLGDDELVLD